MPALPPALSGVSHPLAFFGNSTESRIWEDPACHSAPSHPSHCLLCSPLGPSVDQGWSTNKPRGTFPGSEPGQGQNLDWVCTDPPNPLPAVYLLYVNIRAVTSQVVFVRWGPGGTAGQGQERAIRAQRRLAHGPLPAMTHRSDSILRASEERRLRPCAGEGALLRAWDWPIWAPTLLWPLRRPKTWVDREESQREERVQLSKGTKGQDRRHFEGHGQRDRNWSQEPKALVLLG